MRGGESEKKHVRHILFYKMYKTWNETSNLKSVHVYLTFYRIKPYQPFNQTRTCVLWIQQTNHIFTQSYFTQITELPAAVAS